MPSRTHQGLVRLVTGYPHLLVGLVRRCFGFRVPRVALLPGPETVRVFGSERVADAVLVAWRRRGVARESLVVEVQLRVARGKRQAWALYVVGTWAKLGSPTTLVVLTPSERVARWASRAIDIGRGRTLCQPLVLGPRQIPAEMSLTRARARPESLALSVLIHGHKRGSLSLGRTAIIVARELLASRNEERMVLADLILGAVNGAVRKIVEAEMIVDGQVWFSDVVGNIMKKRAKARKEGLAEGRTKGLAEGRTKGLAEGLAEGRTKGLAEGRTKGLAEGVTKALLMVLEARGLRPTSAQQARIERCQDRKQLETWLQRAVAASSVSAILRSERSSSRSRAPSSPARPNRR
jgi:hypothetical protein